MNSAMRRGAGAIVAAITLAAVTPALAAPPANALETARSLGASEPIDTLTRDVEHQHPIAMMLLAKRLFDAGRRDEAVFWFFEGQLRWRAYIAYAGNQPGHDGFFPTSEGERLQVLVMDIGPDISGYAGGDFPSWVQTMNKALDWDAAHPDDFTPNGPAKDAERKRLRNVADYTLTHQDEVRKSLAANGIEPARHGGDPYDGSGGALFGKPSELLTAYDPKVFAALRVGVTTRAEIVQQLGGPEMWSTDDKGASTFNYGYKSANSALAGFGMSREVTVMLEFNAAKVLTSVSLPDPDK